MPGICKVGYTLKDPALRAAELNHTGSPHPYVVDYEVLVPSPYELEQRVHAQLSAVREGKEWFRCTVEHAVAAVKLAAKGSMLLENHRRVQREEAERIAKQQSDKEQLRQMIDETRRQRRDDALRRASALEAEAHSVRARQQQECAALAPVNPLTHYCVIAFVIVSFPIVCVGFAYPKLGDGWALLGMTVGTYFLGKWFRDWDEQRLQRKPAHQRLLSAHATEISALEERRRQLQNTIRQLEQ